MAWVLIIPICIIGFIVNSADDYWIGSWGTARRAGVGFLAGLLAAFLFWFSASFICTAFVDVEYVLNDVKEIVSLDSSRAFSNGFHPISGEVDIDDRYYFIDKNDASRQKDSIHAYYTSVIRSDDVTPRIEFYSLEWEDEIWSWFASPLVSDMYTVYIPKNDLI